MKSTATFYFSHHSYQLIEIAKQNRINYSPESEPELEYKSPDPAVAKAITRITEFLLEIANFLCIIIEKYDSKIQITIFNVIQHNSEEKCWNFFYRSFIFTVYYENDSYQKVSHECRERNWSEI